MHAFVLVHGGTFGAWAWDRLRVELGRLGHVSLAPDLPIEDPDAGIDDYLAVLMPSIAEAGPGAVLVGHSMGGRIVAYASLHAEVGGLVYLCATVPGTTEAESAESMGNLTVDVHERLRRDHLGRLFYEPADARHVFFHDCPDAVAADAIGRLRPQSTKPIEETRTLERLPSVPSRYVVGTEDRAVRPEYGRAVSAQLIQRPAVEFESSHAPFLSRPADLAALLSHLADELAQEAMFGPSPAAESGPPPPDGGMGGWNAERHTQSIDGVRT